MTEYELYHHGILGMKWGIRRFQNADGSLTSAGSKRYSLGISDAIQRHKDKKKQKERQANLEKARQARAAKKAEKDAFEAKKKKALEDGDFNTLYEMRSKLSDKELNDIGNRLTLEKNIKDKLPKQDTRSSVEKGFDKASDILEKSSKYMDAATKAYDSYQKLAPRLNAVLGLGLPEVPKFSDDKKKKDTDNSDNEDNKSEDKKPKNKKTKDKPSKEEKPNNVEHSDSSSNKSPSNKDAENFGKALVKEMDKRSVSETNLLTDNIGREWFEDRWKK